MKTLLITIDSLFLSTKPNFYLLSIVVLLISDIAAFASIFIKYYCDKSKKHYLILSVVFLAGAIFYLENSSIIVQALSWQPAGVVINTEAHNSLMFFNLTRQLCLIAIVLLAVIIHESEIKFKAGWLRNDSFTLSVAMACILIVYFISFHINNSLHLIRPDWQEGFTSADYLICIWSGLFFGLCALIIYYNNFKCHVWNSIAALMLAEMLSNILLTIYSYESLFIWNFIRCLKIVCRLLITMYIMTDTFNFLKKLCHMRLYDTLTKAYNRSYFFEEMHSLLARKGKKHEFCVLLLDMDKFKQVNDTYGHQQGDVVLKEFSRIIRNNIGPKDIFARLGGDEFAVLLPSITAKEAQRIADRICKEVEKNLSSPSSGLSVDITVSIGIYHSNGSESVKDIIGFADMALYKAKREGRNRCITFSDDEYNFLSTPAFQNAN